MSDTAPTAPSGLLRFSVSGCRAFAAAAEFKLSAGGGRPPPTAVALAGGNAAGKTSMLMALADLRGLVLDSFARAEPDMPPARVRCARAPQSPTAYEIDVGIGGVRWRYSTALDDAGIVSEGAWWWPEGRKAMLFRRDENGCRFAAEHRKLGKTVASITPPWSLLLSTAAASGHPALEPLHAWFRANLLLCDPSNRQARLAAAQLALSADHGGGPVCGLLSASGLWPRLPKVRRLFEEEEDYMEHLAAGFAGSHSPPLAAAGPAAAAQQWMRTGRTAKAGAPPYAGFSLLDIAAVPAGNAGGEPLPLRAAPSGAAAFLALAAPLADALEGGTVLLADDLDSSLAAEALSRTVGMLVSPEANPRSAQLVFATRAPAPSEAPEWEIGPAEKFGLGRRRNPAGTILWEA